MKVSIVVPAYNSEKHIEKCIDSLKNQTYTNLEIIIVNDGSTDETPNLVIYHSRLDPRITIINQVNSGIHLSRLNGIKASTGEVILNVDSDDYLELNAVQLLVNKMLITDADIVIANHYLVRNKEKKIITNSIPTDNLQLSIIKYMLERKLSVFLWGRLFRRHLFENINLPIKRVNSEDIITNMYILCNHKVELALVEEPLYNYIIHGSNVSHSLKTKDVEALINEFQVVEEMLDQIGITDELKQELAVYKSKDWIIYCRRGGLRAQNKKYHREFYRNNYYIAKKHLPIYLRMEMFLYSKNLKIGRYFTSIMLGTSSFLKKGIGFSKMS